MRGMPEPLPLLVLAALSAAAVAALAGFVAPPFARAAGLVDHPGDRKLHRGAMPLAGGFLVLVGVVIPAVAAWWLGTADAAGPLAEARRLMESPTETAAGDPLRSAWLLAGAAVMFFVGLCDDRWKRGFPWWAKLGGQAAAAGCAVAGGAVADVLVLPWLNALASGLWIVTVCNAMNLMDHADGVAAGVGAVAAGLLAAVAAGLGQPGLAALLALLFGAQLGFLVHNAPPARMFLGDAGAHTLGYALSVLTLVAVYVGAESPGLVPVVLPVLVLGLPLFDMAVVVWVRLRSGRSVIRGDRNHLHHRLRRLGMSTRQATWVVWLAAVSVGAGAVALPFVPPAAAAAILGQALVTMALVAALMLFGERASEEPAAPDAP
jgi:UDP-GlcNAc:undecaprenyl-phosphate GlcNAc-1-phosphate transferase